MTTVLILLTTFRLERCSSASPILLTFTTRDTGCVPLLVCCSWRPHVACLLMCSVALGYWRSPPQGALGWGSPENEAPGGKASVVPKLLGDRCFQALLSSWQVGVCFFVFVFLCMLVRHFPFLCSYSQTPGQSLMKRVKLGVQIRQITDSWSVFGQVENYSTLWFPIWKREKEHLASRTPPRIKRGTIPDTSR